MTRNSSKNAFDHVLDKVLNRGDTSPLKKSLIKNGFTDIHSLAMISDDIIDTLTYDDPDNSLTDVPIITADKALLSIFFGFVLHREAQMTRLAIIGRQSPRANLMSIGLRLQI
jgi:hypothetical protein